MEVQQQHKNNGGSLSAPTFTAYSSEKLGDIAARVVGELNLSSSDPFDDDFYTSLNHHQNDAVENEKQDDNDQQQNDVVVEEQQHHDDEKDDDHDVDDDDDEDDESDDESEFEFAVVRRDDEGFSSPISADEIFADGQIRPMFPIFNTDLVFGAQNDGVSLFGAQNDDVSERTMRLPLRKLLTKERENSNRSVTSSSSSEIDDLERIPSGTYCVWTPKKKAEKDEMKIGKKSRSTGSSTGSRRFRIRDLLYNRSNSDGKDTFVFLTPNGGEQKRRDKTTSSKKGGDAKKKSYLPYRRDLVGFFTNVNGISRTVRPF